MRLTQVVFLAPASPWTWGSRKDCNERTRWIPPSGPEKTLEMTLLEGTLTTATADKSSQMCVDTKSPVIRGLHGKSCWSREHKCLQGRRQPTCHIPAQELPGACSSYCPLLPTYLVQRELSPLTYFITRKELVLDLGIHSLNWGGRAAVGRGEANNRQVKHTHQKNNYLWKQKKIINKITCNLDYIYNIIY